MHEYTWHVCVSCRAGSRDLRSISQEAQKAYTQAEEETRSTLIDFQRGDDDPVTIRDKGQGEEEGGRGVRSDLSI